MFCHGKAMSANGRELSGTPDELRGRLYFNLSRRVVGRSRDSGVRSNSLLGGAQRRLFLNELGTTRDR